MHIFTHTSHNAKQWLIERSVRKRGYVQPCSADELIEAWRMGTWKGGREINLQMRGKQSYFKKNPISSLFHTDFSAVW